MPKRIEHINLRNARYNLSKIIKNVGVLKDAYVINVHNIPKALVIDYNDAMALGDLKEFIPKASPNTQGNSLYKFILNWEKNHPLSKKAKQENISENIDKIVYGI